MARAVINRVGVNCERTNEHDSVEVVLHPLVRWSRLSRLYELGKGDSVLPADRAIFLIFSSIARR